MKTMMANIILLIRGKIKNRLLIRNNYLVCSFWVIGC